MLFRSSSLGSQAWSALDAVEEYGSEARPVQWDQTEVGEDEE